MKLKDTIKKLTKKATIMGQCLSAVGWVGGTIDPKAKVVELPMTDVAGAGIATGLAQTGEPVVFVVRFQDFMWLNSSVLVNYAAKAKELFNINVPIFIRSLTRDAVGTGPVHSGTFHSLFMHVPGIKVAAPITPGEYKEVWESFKKDKTPYYVSEHRGTFENTKEIKDIYDKRADITLFGIGEARMKCLQAIKELKKEGIHCNLVNLLWLKGCGIEGMKHAKFTPRGLVVDNGYEICGAAQNYVAELNKMGVWSKAIGQTDRNFRANEGSDVTVERIKKEVKSII